MSGFLSGFRTRFLFWNWFGYWIEFEWWKESLRVSETLYRIPILIDWLLSFLLVFLCFQKTLCQFLCGLL